MFFEKNNLSFSVLNIILFYNFARELKRLLALQSLCKNRYQSVSTHIGT